MAKFEITKRSPRPYKSLLTAADAAALRGIAFMEDAATAGSAKLADGSVPFAGFITRPVQVGGPVLGDSIYPNRIELPTASGDAATFEYAEEFEAEGADYLYSGTGGLTSGTAVGTRCSFKDGKIRSAQTDDIAEFYVAANGLTPEDAGALRIRFGVLNGQKI